MGQYDKMSEDDFDRILGDIIAEEGKAILLVPGVFEVLSEHFNNDVLSQWDKEQGD